MTWRMSDAFLSELYSKTCPTPFGTQCILINFYTRRALTVGKSLARSLARIGWMDSLAMAPPQVFVLLTALFQDRSTCRPQTRNREESTSPLSVMHTSTGRRAIPLVQGNAQRHTLCSIKTRSRTLTFGWTFGVEMEEKTFSNLATTSFPSPLSYPKCLSPHHTREALATFATGLKLAWTDHGSLTMSPNGHSPFWWCLIIWSSCMHAHRHTHTTLCELALTIH